MDKKGVNLGNAYAAVTIILAFGVALGLGVYILTAMSEAVSTTSISVVNETLTFTSNGTSDVFDTSTDCGAHSFSVTDIVNETDAVSIPSANFSIDAATGTVVLLYPEFADSGVNFTYTYLGTTDTSSTGNCGTLTTTGTGLGGMATWVAVIVVVLAAAIVLGIVISSFGKGRTAV